MAKMIIHSCDLCGRDEGQERIAWQLALRPIDGKSRRTIDLCDECYGMPVGQRALLDWLNAAMKELRSPELAARHELRNQPPTPRKARDRSTPPNPGQAQSA